MHLETFLNTIGETSLLKIKGDRGFNVGDECIRRDRQGPPPCQIGGLASL